MQVSVPGMYQNPAPYREQILTYSTALAFTGRSAACAPPMATKAAAEPRTRLLTIFMLNLQVALSGKVPESAGLRHPKVGPLVPCFPPSRFAPSHTRENARDVSEPPKNGTTSGCPPPSHDDKKRTVPINQ